MHGHSLLSALQSFSCNLIQYKAGQHAAFSKCDRQSLRNQKELRAASLLLTQKEYTQIAKVLYLIALGLCTFVGRRRLCMLQEYAFTMKESKGFPKA